MPDTRLLDDLVLARGTLDRAAHRREDREWIAGRLADPATRMIWITEGRAAVDDEGLLLTEPGTPSETTFLGVDSAGIAYFAAHIADSEDGPAHAAHWKDLRGVGARLSDRDAGMMATAVALDNWMRTHTRCPRCGEVTEPEASGWSRRCPQDGSQHFPRTDPAVIVLVRDGEDRALLGRQGAWPPGWMSTLAGFVEAGESAEAAVRREVQEESGVRIAPGLDAIRYLGSQPWPFPCSLMLGYHAWTDDPAIEVDGAELAEARWFSRAGLVAACESGDLRLPPPVSIARKLIERWYGAPLEGDWSRP